MRPGSDCSSQVINSPLQHIIGTLSMPENIAEPITALEFQLLTLIFFNGKFSLGTHHMIYIQQ